MKIYQFEGTGYKPLISYNGWRVAMAGFAEHLSIPKDRVPTA